MPSVIRVITFWLHNKIIQEWVGSSKGLLNFVICSVRLCVSLLALEPQLSSKKGRRRNLIVHLQCCYQRNIITNSLSLQPLHLTNLMQMQMARCPSRLGLPNSYIKITIWMPPNIIRHNQATINECIKHSDDKCAKTINNKGKSLVIPPVNILVILESNIDR